MAAKARFGDLAQVALRLGFGGSEAAGKVEGTFVFAGTIGVGGFGHAGLWVEHDVNGNIVKRMVVKESYLQQRLWDQATTWADPERELPTEAATHCQLSLSKTSSSIVEYRTYAVYPTYKMYRIYMAYCPHGDVERLIAQYQKYDQHGNHTKERIPLHVIACVFEALAAAACLMRDGKLPHEEAHAEWWLRSLGEIIHRDIKPSNVFLGTPDATTWPGIPKPMLGDFGLAIYANTPGLNNPWDYIGAGTKVYMAPEQAIYSSHVKTGRHILNARTNIYTIGRVILSMLNQQTAVEVEAAGYERVTIPESTRQKYPRVFVDLVEQCLEPNPRLRITTDTLFEKVTELVNFRPANRPDIVPLKYNTVPLDVRVLPDTYERFAK